jgi:hypothetical protein
MEVEVKESSGGSLFDELVDDLVCREPWRGSSAHLEWDPC